MGIKHLLLPLILLSITGIASAQAQNCTIKDKDCVFGLIEGETAKIEKQSWRDQTYRELAKSLAANGKLNKAFSLIEKIKTPDTKAMTIRGIGMEAADLNLSKERYSALFTGLRSEAEKITHPPSYAIALTYIAMAQAFAGDNEGAWKTAADMENDALRHKAYGETAEIQADKGNSVAAMKSIAFIESTAYRNKSYSTVAKILTNGKNYDSALKSAMHITNPYKKAEALQYIVNAKTAAEKDNK